MFDSYYRLVNDSSPRSVSITETRAPTDESVRLLKEMEAEARGKVIDTIDLDSNILNGKILLLNDHLNYVVKCIALLEINGNKYEFECKVPGYVARSIDGKEYMYKQIYELIGVKITRMLMDDIQQS